MFSIRRDRKAILSPSKLWVKLYIPRQEKVPPRPYPPYLEWEVYATPWQIKCRGGKVIPPCPRVLSSTPEFVPTLLHCECTVLCNTTVQYSTLLSADQVCVRYTLLYI